MPRRISIEHDLYNTEAGLRLLRCMEGHNLRKVNSLLRNFLTIESTVMADSEWMETLLKRLKRNNQMWRKYRGRARK